MALFWLLLTLNISHPVLVFLLLTLNCLLGNLETSKIQLHEMERYQTLISVKGREKLICHNEL